MAWTQHGEVFYLLCSRSSGLGWQPVLGILTLLMLLPLPFWYSRLGYARQAGFLLFGVAFGIVFQRCASVWCELFVSPL